MNLMNNNATALYQDYQWLSEVIEQRIKTHFGSEDTLNIFDIAPPVLTENSGVYGEVIRHFQLNIVERLVVLLALAPQVAPQALDAFLVQNATTNQPYTEFGGRKGQQHTGFLPTIQTALFLLAGNDFSLRFQYLSIFTKAAKLRSTGILEIDTPPRQEPKWSASIRISEEYLSYFTTGEAYQPDFSSHFPAKHISTQLNWEDLVLAPKPKQGIQEIIDWCSYQDIILHQWNMRKHIKPGYRALFYGPPGTGKTLSASLLGKKLNLPVYRIDLSQVVSKYIGEPEKNMANIFDQAENKNWILFFDEADALFGKRTETNDAHDRHANQEIAYLLQRIEAFSGIVILATNLKSNIDEAFARRFQTMIYFPIPSANERLRLWQNAFPLEHLQLADNVNLRAIAEKYKLTGGAIINVARYCALAAVRRDTPIVRLEDIVKGIRKEFDKEGRI